MHVCQKGFLRSSAVYFLGTLIKVSVPRKSVFRAGELDGGEGGQCDMFQRVFVIHSRNVFESLLKRRK